MNSVFILSTILVLTVVGLGVTSADAQKTSGYNFCKAFPAFPECSGWRTEAITDNYWFCEYVFLSSLCTNPPDPQKQITLRDNDYCCRFIGEELKTEQQIVENGQEEIENILPDLSKEKESIRPLIIWTDKDHYNYRDKVTVYGKFDFDNPTIIKNIDEFEFEQTGEKTETFDIDIKLNGRIVLRDIQVSQTGWFSTFFFIDNKYNFSTQNNLLEVEYIVTAKDIPPGGPKTHATYHFTTGNISREDESFDLWLDNTLLPDKITYGLNSEQPERILNLMRQDLVKTRLTTPEGYVIPIASVFSIQNLSTQHEGFAKYGKGTYELRVTYGDNMAKKTFEIFP